jgi:hypothetical protein
MGALSQSPKDFFNMAQQSLLPKLNLLRVFLAFLGNNTPMTISVFRNYLDGHHLTFSAASFEEFLQNIGALRMYTGPALVHIHHYPDCDSTPRERPCEIRVVFQLPE